MNEPVPPPLPRAQGETELLAPLHALPGGFSFHDRFPFPTWLEVALMPAMFMMLQVAIGVAGAVILAAVSAFTRTSIHEHMGLLFLGSLIAMVPVLAWGWWRSRLSFAETFGFRRVSIAVLAAIVPLSIGGNFLLSEFSNLQQSLFPLPNFFEGVFTDLFDSPVMGLVVLSVMAPLTEEPLFRGLILGGLARRKRVRTAALASAVAFSLMHCNPAQMPSAFALGLVYAWIFVRTRSLWPCLLAHAVHNGIGHVVTHVLRMEIRGYNSPPQLWVFQPAWFNAAGIGLIFLGIAGILLAVRRLPSGSTVTSGTEGNQEMAAMHVVSAVLACGTYAGVGAALTTGDQTPLKLAVAGDTGTQTAWLTVGDVEGSYTIPYIQSSPGLAVEVSFAVEGVVSAQVALMDGAKTIAERRAEPPESRAEFPALEPGEYEVQVRALDATGNEVCQAMWERVAIGTVIAALGDSITEGYYGQGYLQEGLDLRGERFPKEAVSRDGRNFPQYSPTTHQHLPSVNCFESWMTQLNDSLSASWKQPVFIANEGWGGITTAGYLDMIRTDAGWRTRMMQMRPSIWLIHLGVNDERGHVPAEEYAANMRKIVDTLIEEFGARPEGLFIAKPSYDYFEGAPEILADYCKAIDRLAAEHGLRKGPDLFALYATERERWYGQDPVHPNVAGMERMAEAWHDALVAALPDEPKR